MKEIFSGLLCALLQATETAGRPASLSWERRESDKGGYRNPLVPMVLALELFFSFFKEQSKYKKLFS